MRTAVTRCAGIAACLSDTGDLEYDAMIAGDQLVSDPRWTSVQMTCAAARRHATRTELMPSCPSYGAKASGTRSAHFEWNPAVSAATPPRPVSSRAAEARRAAVAVQLDAVCGSLAH